MRERGKEGEREGARKEGAVLMYVPGSLKKQIYCLRDHNVLTLIEY